MEVSTNGGTPKWIVFGKSYENGWLRGNYPYFRKHLWMHVYIYIYFWYSQHRCRFKVIYISAKQMASGSVWRGIPPEMAVQKGKLWWYPKTCRTGDHWSAPFALCQHCLRQREKQFSENHMATYLEEPLGTFFCSRRLGSRIGTFTRKFAKLGRFMLM